MRTFVTRFLKQMGLLGALPATLAIAMLFAGCGKGSNATHETGSSSFKDTGTSNSDGSAGNDEANQESGSSGTTGGKSPDGRPYTNFLDKNTLATATKDLEDNLENRKFANQIEWAKTEFSGKDIVIIIKWLGLDKPLSFKGPVNPQGNNFASQLTEQTGQVPNLKMTVNIVDNAGTIFDALLQDGQNHKAQILIHVDQKKLTVVMPTGKNAELLPQVTKNWASQVQKNGASVVRISTAIYPGGKSFYIINMVGGQLEGDLLDTNKGYVATQAQGIFSQIGNKIELMGNSQAAKGNQLVFKVTNEAKPKNKSAVKQDEKSAVKAEPKSVPMYLLFEDDVPAQTQKVFPPGSKSLPAKGQGPAQAATPSASPTPAVSISNPPSNQPLTVNVPKVNADAHWMAKQIMLDESNPQLQGFIRTRFVKGYTTPRTNFGLKLDLYLSCKDKTMEKCPSLKIDRREIDRAEVVEKADAVLKQNGFSQNWTWLATLESDLNPFNVNPTSKAGGMWQFLPSTGKAFGLFSSGKDKRFDVLESTQAASDYLEKLMKYWNQDVKMAVSSYYFGEANVQRACRHSTQITDKSVCEFGSNNEPDLEDLRNLKTANTGKFDFWYFRENHMFGNAAKAIASKTKDPEEVSRIQNSIRVTAETVPDYVMRFVGGSIIGFNPEPYGYDHKPIDIH